MKNILYIDKEFRVGFGADKNRSRYLYDALNIYNLHLCIIGDTSPIHFTETHLNLNVSNEKSFLTPDAILEFENKELHKVIKYIQENKIESIFIRTIAYTRVAKHIKKLMPNINIIIDVDLILSRLMAQAWKKERKFSKRYYLIESIKLKKYEKDLYKNAFTFLYTNKNEVEYITKKFSQTNAQYLQNTTDLEPKEPSDTSSRVILFYGSMDSTSNMDGYKYIHDTLYPLIQDALVKNNYEIHIVGKGCDKLFESQRKEIKIIGPVDCIDVELLRSSFVILPINIASGTNTRVLEVALKGKPLLTTPLGMEGLCDNKHMECVTNNEFEMAEKIVNMMNDSAVRLKNASILQNEIMDKFSMSAFIASLHNIIKKTDNKTINLVHIPRRFTASSWGGTETVVIKSANNLSSYGYVSSIYTSKALDSKESDMINDIPIKRFNYFYPWLGMSQSNIDKLDAVGGNLFSFSMLFALILKKDIDLIHLHTLKRMGSIGRFVAKLKKIPYVVTLHGGYFNISKDEVEHREKLINNGFEWGKILGLIFGSRKVLNDASAIITLSEEEYSKAKNKYGNKVHYLSNGVDISQFKQGNANRFKDKYNLPNTQNTILCSGRIDTQKNQLLLLEAFNNLLTDGHDLYLVLIGAISDIDYYKQINTYIEENNLERKITMIHDLTPKDALLVDAYHYADLLVLPSRHEPFGMVILEAWASNLAVVASSTGGIKKIIKDKVNGLLFENSSLESLQESIQKVLINEELKNTLISNAQVDVLKYDWKEVTKSLDNIYTNILKIA